jgi:hypothetical protein
MDIEQLENRLVLNINYLNTNKHKLSPEKYHQLINYHVYSMNLLNSLKQPIRSSLTDNNPYVNPKNKDDTNAYYAEWHSQFSETVKNPPMYTLPPNNVYTLPPFHN